MTPGGSDHAGRRAGFTLVEVLLVAGLLATLAAIVLPATRPMFERAQLRQEAGRVLTALAAAREGAIAEGRVGWVRCEADGPTLLAGADGEGFSTEVTLAGGPRFEAAGETGRLSDWEIGDGAISLRERVWSQPLLYFPDGSSNGGRVTVSDDSGRSLTVEISTLTAQPAIASGASE